MKHIHRYNYFVNETNKPKPQGEMVDESIVDLWHDEKKGDSIRAIISPDKKYAWVIDPQISLGTISNAVANNMEWFNKLYPKANVQQLQHYFMQSKNQEKIGDRREFDAFKNKYQEVFLISSTRPMSPGEGFIKLK